MFTFGDTHNCGVLLGCVCVCVWFLYWPPPPTTSITIPQQHPQISLFCSLSDLYSLSLSMVNLNGLSAQMNGHLPQELCGNLQKPFFCLNCSNTWGHKRMLRQFDFWGRFSCFDRLVLLITYPCSFNCHFLNVTNPKTRKDVKVINSPPWHKLSNPDRRICIFWEDHLLKTSYSSTIQICKLIQPQKEILHTVVFVELVWNAALERQWSSFLWAQRGAQEAKDLYDKRSMGVLKSHWQCASASKTQLFSWITKRCSDVGLLCILESLVNPSKN